MNCFRRYRTSQVLALILVHCVALTAFGVTPRPRRTKRQPTKITFDDSEPKLEPGKIVKIKATVFDQNNADMPAAVVKWDPPPQGSDDLISVSKPLEEGTNVIILTGRTPKSSTQISADIKIHATSGNAANDLVVHFQSAPKPDAKEITFVVSPDKNELSAGSKTTITATVRDKQGNAIPGAEVDWSIDKQFDDFAGRGAVVKDARSSTFDVFGRAGNGKSEDVPIVVVANGGGVSGIVRLTYKPSKADGANIITFNKPSLPIRAGEEGSFVVMVKDDEAAKISAEVADEKNKPFLLVSKPERGEIKVTGLSGSRSAEAPSVILITVKSGTAIASFPVIYRRGIETYWDVLPPNIVGDNFGRTIKKDYYCIEVSINNDSASDLSLAGMGFDLNKNHVRPNTSYATVHGSLARRKLTHPRTLTLAAIDAAGSLMTGFNPFFHNINHAKNFSQWIDIVSNPLAKGLDKVWKDSYVDEMARLESDVLRDDKVITKNSAFKTRIFFPRKGLSLKDADRNDMEKVREALGELVIIGYKFDRGNLVRF